MCSMALNLFHPAVSAWFAGEFEKPTEAHTSNLVLSQAQGWSLNKLIITKIRIKGSIKNK